ncbi:MAG: CBS domain-containing protein [Planctomycetota bacterium]
MTDDLITITPDAMIIEVFALMSQHRIRHLPVLEGEELVGIISNRDLYRMLPSDTQDPDRVTSALYQTKVRGVMTMLPLHTIQADEPIADAARMLVRERVSCLPVMHEHKLVGLITSDDLLIALLAQPAK